MIVGWTFDRSFKICFNSDTKSMQICNNQRQNTILVYSDCEMPKTCIELFSIFLLLFLRCLLFYIPFGSGSFCDIIKYLLVFVEKCNKWKQRLFFFISLVFSFRLVSFLRRVSHFFFSDSLLIFSICSFHSFNARCALYTYLFIYIKFIWCLLKSFEIKKIFWYG